MTALRIPIVVLTGFLGSGKTTLLNDVLRMPAFSGTAVIVNEFGDIDIDHDLVVVEDGAVAVTTTGCICCTAGSDIISSLASLCSATGAAQARAFDRVIVETTGLADPAPIINQLLIAEEAANRGDEFSWPFHLAGVVATVDAVMGEFSLERHFECMKQLAFANRIVVTKTDMARDPASRADTVLLKRRLAALNPAAEILDRHRGNFDLHAVFASRPYIPQSLGADVEGWLQLEAALPTDGKHAGQPGSRHDGIASYAWTADSPISATAFDRFLARLRHAKGAELLRLKGLIALEGFPDRPIVVHAVQHVLHDPVELGRWPSEDRRTRLVVIAAGLSKKRVRRLFAELSSPARPLRPKQLAVLSLAVVAFAAVFAGGLLMARQSAAHNPPVLERPFHFHQLR